MLLPYIDFFVFSHSTAARMILKTFKRLVNNIFMQSDISDYASLGDEFFYSRKYQSYNSADLHT